MCDRSDRPLQCRRTPLHDADISGLIEPDGQAIRSRLDFSSHPKLLVLFFVLLLSLWSCAERNPFSGPDPFSSDELERATINGPLRSHLQINQGLIVPGSEAFLEATFEVRNISADPVIVEFSSGQQYDLWIEDPAGNQYWKWSSSRVFTTMLVSRELDTTPWVYHEKIPTVDAKGVPLRPGVYMLYARLTGEPAIQNWVAFKVDDKPDRTDTDRGIRPGGLIKESYSASEPIVISTQGSEAGSSGKWPE